MINSRIGSSAGRAAHAEGAGEDTPPASFENRPRPARMHDELADANLTGQRQPLGSAPAEDQKFSVVLRPSTSAVGVPLSAPGLMMTCIPGLSSHQGVTCAP